MNARLYRLIHCSIFLGLFLDLGSPLQGAFKVDLSAYYSESEIRIERGGDLINIRWLGSQGIYCELVLSLLDGTALVKSVGTMADALNPAEIILRDFNPVTLLTVGERDLSKRAGWVIFFDKVHTRASKTSLASLELEVVQVSSSAKRAVVELSRLTAGSFSGVLRFTFVSGSSLVRVDSVLSTQEDARAIVYDAGIGAVDPSWSQAVWMDSADRMARSGTGSELEASTPSVRFRTVLAEGEKGSVALFPPPHQFFYPLDFADNFGFVWSGSGYRDLVDEVSLGVRQPLDGDRRYVPWFNAPPKSEQRLGVYWYLTPSKGKDALNEVARYTRNDHYEALPEHRRFTSHYHVEHTLNYLKRQEKESISSVPGGLEDPGFVRAFKRIGADIVHLAEFHNGRTPRLEIQERLRKLDLMHEECERLSDDSFLLLPGEEPNVHLGGHWLSFFPKPVHWVLNRPDGVPFVEEMEGGRKVYHVGSKADVLELMKREQGLMWTAHARIKGSTGYPDLYREEPFFFSDRFLGAAWKAMPADLSWNRLGKRVLGLMDDMANWGERKYVLGEVDVFRVEPDYELYGHMNMNYLRLDRVPSFGEGWGSVLDAIRGGRFFVTTGEVLIPRFAISGKESGETVKLGSTTTRDVEFELNWTFPLAFAEIISGDGNQVFRESMDLRDRTEFGKERFTRSLDLRGKQWVRLEVWDSAANGAFTQPVWLEK
ncbi:MAG: hypothetical protein HOI66_14895 [Verrucomicrobia bacterium]|jgi:hypothetical protein|nr:hypothetical protein [Verrucomicrobiota bacterium]MDA7510395.1 hypothetical protein [Verrucomicrobiota bacterium]